MLYSKKEGIDWGPRIMNTADMALATALQVYENIILIFHYLTISFVN